MGNSLFKGSLQLAGQWTGRAASHLAAVDGYDGCDLHGGGGDQHLIGTEEFFYGEGSLRHGNPQLFR